MRLVVGEGGGPGMSEPVRIVRERVRERDCEMCAQRFTVGAKGRIPSYCSPACRQRAWALRRAGETLGRGDPRPQVVREVVDRVEQVFTETPTEGFWPSRARPWAEGLDQLAAQLTNPRSPLHREHWQHRRLNASLIRVLTALDQATPGGLANLDH